MSSLISPAEDNPPHLSTFPPPAEQFGVPVSDSPAERIESQLSVRLKSLDDDIITRNLCYVALAVGWTVAIACITTATYVLVKGPEKAPEWILGRQAIIGPIGFNWVPNPTPRQSSYVADHRIFQVSQAAMVIIPLILNFVLTYVFDAVNFIHETSLRWALWSEGRLVYNSNPRLFSSTTRHGPNKWYSNVVGGLALALSFGGLSVITFPVTIVASVTFTDKHLHVNPEFTGPRYAIDVNSWGMLGVGMGLFLQCTISSWCLIQTGRQIGTWNGNPLAVARACKRLGFVADDDLEMVEKPVRSEPSTLPSTSATAVPRSSSLYSFNASGDHDIQPLRVVPPKGVFASHSRPKIGQWPSSSSAGSQLVVCSLPQRRQPSVKTFIPRLRYIVGVLWAITSLIVIWVIVIAVIGHITKTSTRSWVEEQLSPATAGPLDYWEQFGQVAIQYENTAWFPLAEWRGLLIQTAVIGVPLLGFHYAEIIVQLVRDEKIWRRAATPKGANPDATILFEDARCWHRVFYFILKALMPWIYSYAVSSNVMIFMALPPLCVFAFLFVVLTVFLEITVRYRPSGPQPPTYGNIRSLIGLIDDFSHDKIFWGDKGKYSKSIRLAGTAGTPLDPLDPHAMYTGLRLSSRIAPVGKTVDVVKAIMV
jgi:hypothetical protein